MEELFDKIAEALATLMFICSVFYMFYRLYEAYVNFRKKLNEEVEREKRYERNKIETMVKYINFLNGNYQHGKI